MTVTVTPAALAALDPEISGLSDVLSYAGVGPASTTPLDFTTVLDGGGVAFALDALRAIDPALARLLACDIADAATADRPAGDTALAAAITASRGYAAGTTTEEQLATAYHAAWMAAHDLLTPARDLAETTIWAGLDPLALNYHQARRHAWAEWDVPVEVQWSDAERLASWAAVAAAQGPGREVWAAKIAAGHLPGVDVDAVIRAWATDEVTPLASADLLIAATAYHREPVLSSTHNWTTGAGVAAGSGVIFALQQQGATTLPSSVTVSEGDGSNPTAMTALGAPITIDHGAAGYNVKQAYYAEALPALTAARFNATYGSSTRATPLGGFVEVAAGVDFANAVVTGNTVFATNPSVDVTTQAGVLAIFGMSIRTESGDPASVTQTPAFAGVPLWARDNAARVGSISAVELAAAESPAAQVITRTTEGARTDANVGQPGLLAVMAPPA